MGLFRTPHPRDQTLYGFHVKWSEHHWTPEDLHPLIYTYDTVSAEAVEQLDKIEPPAAASFAPKKNIQETYEPKDKKHSRDLFKLVKQHATADEKIGKFWEDVNAVPDWVDWEAVERGQKVFWRYGGPCLTAVSRNTHLSVRATPTNSTG
jgi:hypothetical protein